MQNKKGLLTVIKRDKYLLLMFLPVFIYYIIFCYWPMTGIVMAFKNFRPGNGIYEGAFVGAKWFVQFFESAFFWRLIRNTFLLAFYSLIFGFPIPIIFAVCITQMRHKVFQKPAQVITYLPYFISTVVIAGMITNFLSPSDGIVNKMIEFFGGEEINFLMEPGWFRSVYVISKSWQSFGFNSIIFVAAIMGIPGELYEAMKVDGASKWRQIWHLVLPSIRPTVVLLLILSLGGIMSVGFEQVYLLYNPSTYETADVISTYVYRQGILNQNFSYATAVGLFNSMISFVVVASANKISRYVSDTAVW